MVSDEFEQELERAFSGIMAPARLSASVMNRVRTPPPTRLPEILDAIGWIGVLSAAACIAFFAILK